MDPSESAGRLPTQLAQDNSGHQERINITEIYMASIGAAWDDIEEEDEDG